MKKRIFIIISLIIVLILVLLGIFYLNKKSNNRQVGLSTRENNSNSQVLENVEQEKNEVEITYSKVENIEALNEFIGKMDKDNEKRKSESITIIQYTREGDKIYTTLNYIKETDTFELVIDNREDRFAAEENKMIKNSYPAECYEIVKGERDEYIDIKLRETDDVRNSPPLEDIIICAYNKKLENTYSFYGYVTYSTKNHMRVRPENDTKDLFVILEKDNYPIYENGTYVKITYDGVITESYPGKVRASNIEFIRPPVYI